MTLWLSVMVFRKRATWLAPLHLSRVMTSRACLQQMLVLPSRARLPVYKSSTRVVQVRLQISVCVVILLTVEISVHCSLLMVWRWTISSILIHLWFRAWRYWRMPLLLPSMVRRLVMVSLSLLPRVVLPMAVRLRFLIAASLPSSLLVERLSSSMLQSIFHTISTWATWRMISWRLRDIMERTPTGMMRLLKIVWLISTALPSRLAMVRVVSLPT